MVIMAKVIKSQIKIRNCNSPLITSYFYVDVAQVTQYTGTLALHGEFVNKKVAFSFLIDEEYYRVAFHHSRAPTWFCPSSYSRLRYDGEPKPPLRKEHALPCVSCSV